MADERVKDADAEEEEEDGEEWPASVVGELAAAGDELR